MYAPTPQLRSFRAPHAGASNWWVVGGTLVGSALVFGGLYALRGSADVKGSVGPPDGADPPAKPKPRPLPPLPTPDEEDEAAKHDAAQSQILPHPDSGTEPGVSEGATGGRTPPVFPGLPANWRELVREFHSVVSPGEWTVAEFTDDVWEQLVGLVCNYSCIEQLVDAMGPQGKLPSNKGRWKAWADSWVTVSSYARPLGGWKESPQFPPYVGSGWLWPHRDKFPTDRSFGEALAVLGYGAAYGLPDWKILDTSTIRTVEKFQRDYNAVVTWSDVGMAPISVDGLVGNATINALLFALDYNTDSEAFGRPAGDSWLALVTDARHYHAQA